MAAEVGPLDVLNDPVAQRLLNARVPARLAYVWHDGTPRVVPVWFHWDGEEIVIGGPPDAPKAGAIRLNPHVALTIDDASEWPYSALILRGIARVEDVQGVSTEYAECASRYFGPEQGQNWVQMVDQMFDEMACIRIRPNWAQVLDFQTRFPSKFASRMG